MRPSGPGSPTPATTSCGGSGSRAARRWSPSCGPGCKRSLTARGVSESDAAWTDEALDPRVLTIGFARRFAAYKRATLLLSQPERLQALLLSADRPVQFVFAGKAHPADDLGKEMIRQIVQFCRDPACATGSCSSRTTTSPSPACCTRARDVWLNTPRRPHGGVRHQRREGRAQRAPSTARSSTAGGTRCSTATTAGPSPRPRRTRTWPAATRSRPTACSSSSSARSCRCSTTASKGRSPAAGSAGSRRRSSRSDRSVVASRMVSDYVERDVRAHRGAGRRHVRSRSTPGPGRWRRGSNGSTAAWPQVHVDSVETEERSAVADLGATRHVSVLVALGDADRRRRRGAAAARPGRPQRRADRRRRSSRWPWPVWATNPATTLRRQLHLRAGRPLRLRRPGRARPPRPAHPGRDWAASPGRDASAGDARRLVLCENRHR